MIQLKRIGCVRDNKVYIHKDIDEVTEGHIAEVLGYKILRDRGFFMFIFNYDFMVRAF